MTVILLALAGCGGSSVSSPTPPPTPPPSSSTEPNSCKSTNLTSPAQTAPTANYAGTAFSGTVLAGGQPVVGASVQLYAAGTTGNGSAATPLLSTPVKTSATGSFSVPAYTCPLSNAVLLVVATGGGANGSAANPASVLATVPGVCGSLQGAPSFTVNELTTVATAYAMQPFLAAGSNAGTRLGASATNASGIALAAATVANLVNLTTGTAPGAGFPASGVAPVAKMNSLANLLNSCVTVGSGSQSCTQLFSATASASSTPTNTFDAAANVARQPATNAASIYTLSTTGGSYAPVLTAAPPDWVLYATYKGGGLSAPASLSIDSTGNVWVANYPNRASEFSNTGAPLSSSGYQVPGVSVGNQGAYGGAVNVADAFWMGNQQVGGSSGLGSISTFTSAGLGGTFSGGGLNFPTALAFDPSGVAWAVDYGDSSVSLFSPSQSPLATNGYTSSHLIFPVAIATDADCNAYVANSSSDTVTLVTADGSSFTDFVTGTNTKTGVGPSGVAIDASGNVWVANYYGSSVGLITGGTTLASGAGFTGGGIVQPEGIAADGAGNVWLTNYRGVGISELAGTGSGSAGTALSPTAAWGPDAPLLEAFGLAIDAGGSVWVTSFGNDSLTEFIGMATPVKTPLLGPVRVP
jgi:hypothetical protein